MPRHQNRQVTNLAEDAEREVARVLCNRCLLIPGALLSVCGFSVGSLGFLNIINFSYFNRYLHLGKNKWILKSVPMMFGVIGLLFILCAFPAAREKLRGFCCRGRNRNTGIPYAPLDEEAPEAT